MAGRQHNPRAVRAARPDATRIVYSIVALLALAGLADALYLTVLDLTGQAAACGGSTSCSEVLSSKYSHLGSVPVAALGLLAYFTVFSCAVLVLFGQGNARLVLNLTVTLMFLGTLWFVYVQAFILHQYCRYCLLSAALTFFLAGLLIVTPARPVHD
jgi:uncharacterized membrane protein